MTLFQPQYLNHTFLFSIFFTLATLLSTATQAQNTNDTTWQALQQLETTAEGLYYSSKYEQSLQVLNQLLAMGNPTRHRGFYVSAANLKAICYFELAEYDSAQQACLLALKHSQTAFQKGSSYSTYARYHGLQGDIDKELVYHQQALEAFLDTLGPSHDFIATMYSNIGSCYHHKFELDKALSYYQKNLALRQAKLADTVSKGYALSLWTIGSCYGDMGQHPIKINYLNRALAIQYQLGGHTSKTTARLYHDLGKAYYKLGDTTQSWQYLNKGLDLRNRIYSIPSTALSSSHEKLGNLHLDAGQWHQALARYQQSIVALCHTFRDTSYATNPSPADASSQIELLVRLDKKGYALLQAYYTYQTPQYLAAANSTYRLALGMIDQLRSRNISPGAKRSLSASRRSVYEGSIEAAWLLHQAQPNAGHHKRAFGVSEKSRAYMMLQALNETGARQFGGIPQPLINQERALKNKLTHAEKQLLKARQRNDSASLASWGHQLNQYRLAYDSVIQVFETQNPAYYQLKYDIDMVTVAEIQQHLPDAHHALVEYFVGERNIYAFVINQQQLQWLQLPRDFALAQWVAQMRNGLYDYFFTEMDARTDSLYQQKALQYVNMAVQLHNKLFAPLASTGALTKNLMVVPDAELGFIPFNILLTSQPANPLQFKTHPYLLQQHAISYAYSASLLPATASTHHAPPKNSLLAFAPSFKDYGGYQSIEGKRRTGLYPLQFNATEVNSVVNTMGGQGFVAQQATKENFLANAPNYRVLHISSHAKANNLYPKLSFVAFTGDTALTDPFLYLADIYNLRLKADMVVLSACETGFGKLYTGEGIASLAQGFTYAGSKSIITTLWSVDDRSTSDIITAFYQNLKQGMRKDAALHTAQQQFLASEQLNNQYAHPFYWAGIIPVGNMAPLSKKSNFPYWVVPIVLIIALPAFSKLRRNKK